LSASFAAGRIGGAEKRIKGDMERLRSAHREVTADIDAMQTRLDQLETAIAFGAPAAPQIEAAGANTELKLIDQIVDKLGAAMDARIQNIQGAANVTPMHPITRGPMASSSVAGIVSTMPSHFLVDGELEAIGLFDCQICAL
jgi:hypothetical protein